MSMLMDGKFRFSLSRFLVCVTPILVATILSRPASGYTPEDPVVKGMIDKGIAYLETLNPTNFVGGQPDSFSGGAGEVVLVAYAHHKCRHDPDNPTVKRGIAMAKKMVQFLEQGKGDFGVKRNYEMAVCILLFAEVDPIQYRPQLAILQKHLIGGQYANGAFGYPGEKDGDVSQTQYAMLGIWTLDRNGLPLDYNRVVSTIQWLLRVQDPTGGWPYKGKDPGIGKPLRPQEHVDTSMALAGGSSVLIAGDALRLWGETIDENDPGIPGLPKAIKIYKEDSNLQRRKRVSMSQTPIKNAAKRMDAWRQKNPYERGNLVDWYYYLMYTMERYESFVEISNGLPKDQSPAWYNKGVEELRGFQGPDGAWNDRAHSRAPVATSFALLFLIRSTQKTIFTMSAGSLQGGYGLPKDTTEIRVEGTQIKGRAISAQVTDMLDLLEADGGDLEGKSLPENLQLATDPVDRAAQLDRLERLVRGSRSWQARRVAARLLGKSDELRVVPALIYALSDPDDSVRRYARDGLRFLSRKFDGFGMPDKPDIGELQKAQKAWRAWYRTMNPKYVFLDYDL